ncbi:methionine aminopeptidase 1D, mitochondrial isoform X2 [Bicyclus anynana]|uniref:Methionine aminopeptidase n=1 Tax=Bicyclus anynana TaxID=110368 RepID=A0A6J1NMX3_BICAN|nr:methionine aminopeptidase 1D, mitochondrial isoform X2 [Bicyclus anynana]XP_023946357.2 methionine aminopeptidase 1D, mitochondrial isoform X2 [Bicyclus anynana]
MRIPKSVNPRIQKELTKRFGVYDKVLPAATTPSRLVPDYIVQPDYVTNKLVFVNKKPEIKDEEQIKGMRSSCTLASNILKRIGSFIQPGITTDDIDELAHTLSIAAGAYPSPLNYKGFPKSVCTSVNNVAVHGIPDLRPLKNGDIVNVDITVFFNGYHGDCSKTFLVGDVDDQGLHLVHTTDECLRQAIDVCGPDVPFCDIGMRIYRVAKKNKLTVLPAFVGHGIGKYFHGPPDIYHTINHYPGIMKPGMTFTIEPVLSHGKENTVILDDGWTIITEDGSRAAQAEHTVLITKDGTEVLTK